MALFKRDIFNKPNENRHFVLSKTEDHNKLSWW